jgi:hypothetical protein
MLGIHLEDGEGEKRFGFRAVIQVAPCRPVRKEMTASTRNTNNVLKTTLAAFPAMPQKPRMAATISMTTRLWCRSARGGAPEEVAEKLPDAWISGF